MVYSSPQLYSHSAPSQEHCMEVACLYNTKLRHLSGLQSGWQILTSWYGGSTPIAEQTLSHFNAYLGYAMFAITCCIFHNLAQLISTDIT